LGLLWVANAARTDLGPPLPVPPPGVLVAGHFLGVLGLPLYALGYWQIGRGLAAGHPRSARAVFVLGAYAAALGAAVHGMTALVIVFGRSSGGLGGDPVAVVARFATFLGPLWALLGVLSLLASGLYAVAVARGGTAFPRWMAVANPILLVLATSLSAAGSRRLQAFLVPAAPNLAHVVLFALATVTLRPDASTRGAALKNAHRPGEGSGECPSTR
jgi:uncharacterized protein DUF6796